MPLRTTLTVLQAKLQNEGSGFTVSRPYPHGKQLTDKMTDPFLMMDEWGPKQISHEDAGTQHRPHRGHDSFTYFKQGAGAYEDTMGNKGVVEEGEAQFVRAGNGLILSEGHPHGLKEGEQQSFQAFQIWTNLPQEMKLCPPQYQHISEPSLQWQEYTHSDSAGVRMKVIAGAVQLDEETRYQSPVDVSPMNMLILDVELALDGVCYLPIPEDMPTLLVYVYLGMGKFGPEGEGGAEAKRMDVIVFDQESKGMLRLESLDPEMGCHCIVMAGKPLGEPITSAGGFVANDAAGVMAAFKDNRDNTLVTTKAEEIRH